MVNWWMSLLERGAAPSLQALAERAAHTPGVAQTWSSALGIADARRRDRRLAWAHTSEAPDLPEWVSLLRSAFGDTPDDCASAFDAAARCSEAWLIDGEPCPFERLVLPLACAALSRIEPALGSIHPAALAPVRHALIAQLSSLMSRLLYAHFAAYRSLRTSTGFLAAGTSDAMYRAWETSMRHGGIHRLLHDYPVAARLISTRAVLWGDMLREFVERLDDDRADISTLIGQPVTHDRIARVSGADSDPHNGGRQVLIVEFAGGARVVYKPRSLAMEALHGELLAWLGTVDPAYAAWNPKILDRGTHGWMEFIDAQPVASIDGVRRFYERAGALLALYYAVGASDLHFENIVAAGEHPIVIDHEMLLGPEIAVAGTLPAGGMGGTHRARHALADSVLRTALLPMLKVSAAGEVMDVAGLATTSALASAAQEVSVLALTHAHTDDMRLMRCQTPPRARPPHVPVLHGRCVPVSAHIDALLTGFDRVYAALLARRGELTDPDGLLARVGSAPVRVLVRATNLYAQLAERARHPECLRDPMRRRAELEVLARPLLTADERPPIFDAIEHEIAALERLDIPCFTVAADSTVLHTADGKRVGACLDRTPIEHARERLASLTESDRHLQQWIIRSALGAADAGALTLSRIPRRARTARAARPARSRLLRDSARRLADTLASDAVLDGQSPLWHAVVYDARAKRFQVGMTPLSWLDGTLGIGAFLAEAAIAFDAPHFRELAASVISEAEPSLNELRRFIPDRPWVDIGIGTGLGSAAAGIAVVSQRLHLPRNPALQSTLRELMHDAITRNACGLDLTAGLAGAVLGAIVAHETTGDTRWHSIAAEWGDTLLRRLDAEQTPTAIGMAHGVDGIAFALRRLAGVTASDDVAARAASLEATARRTWQAARETLHQREREAAWSHGASGLLVARLAALDGTHTNAPGRSEAISEIHGLLGIVRDRLLEGSDDLCCGRAGRAEALSVAADRLGDPGLAVLARQLRSTLARRVHTGAPLALPGESDHPALWTGRAGVGLSLLRSDRTGVLDPFFVGAGPCAPDGSSIPFSHSRACTASLPVAETRSSALA